MRRLLAFATTAALLGCQAVPGAPAFGARDAPVAPVVKERVVCAPFEPWSQADLDRLADAVSKEPGDGVILKLALDWRRYYGDAKACASSGGH